MLSSLNISVPSVKYEKRLNLVIKLLPVLIVATLFGISTLSIISLGQFAVAVWIIGVSTFAMLYLSYDAKEILSEDNENAEEVETKDISGGEQELREFIYLDSLTVQSLLASLNIAISEQFTEVSEQTEQISQRARLNAGIKAQGVGQVGGSVDLSKTETGAEILETSKRINDQYIFNQLHGELKRRKKITELPDDWENSPDEYNLGKDMDIIKITGSGKTDPIYRLANVLSLLSRIEDSDTDGEKLSEQISKLKDSIYADQIGVEFDVGDDISYVASVGTNNLWVDDPRREFADSREYTVLGRVVGTIPEDEQWDYIDIFRVGGTVLDNDSIGSIREVLTQFVELIDGFTAEVPLPDLQKMTPEKLQSGKEPPDEPSSIKVNIEDKKICVEGPGLIIDPIAIYW